MQAPEALHVPTLSVEPTHVVGQAASGPEVTFVHMPEGLQARQLPLHAALQQTPSTQKPLPQEPPAAGQACPLIQPVHWPVVTLQPRPFAHWASVVHTKQAVPAQVLAPHEVVMPAAQTPAPLQVAAVVWE